MVARSNESAGARRSANEQLLVLGHQIREKEHELRVARRRRSWSNLSLIFGPVVLLILYVTLWLPWMDKQVLVAVYIPGIPITIGFCISTIYLKRLPGGPSYPDPSNKSKKKRDTEGQIELKLAQIRDARKLIISEAGFDTRVRRLIYKEDAYSEIERLRADSNRYRRVNNILQGILIIGSLSATGAAGIAGELPQVRWGMLGLTFAVGISSGFLGYFKYKERSFYLQQTADSIESEWEALEIGVGRYKGIQDESTALENFSEEVHRLKSEQKKRQQNLEQPPELRSGED